MLGLKLIHVSKRGHRKHSGWPFKLWLYYGSGVSRKSYKTNRHLFSANAGVVWRMWIRIIALEKTFFWVFWGKSIHGEFYTLFHPYGVPYQMCLLFCIMSYKGHCVYHWMIPMTVTRKLTSMFSNLTRSGTKRIDKIIFFLNVDSSRKTRKMNLSLDRNQQFLYFLVNVHLLCHYNEFIS